MKEIVLASNESAMDAHRRLYSFGEEAYVIVGEDMIGTLTAFSGDPERLHISSDWSDLVRLATWKPRPKTGDLFLLLTAAGITEEKLLPFRDADVADIFPWLYYSRRFDVLRKMCRTAKANAERHLRKKDARVHCHLTSDYADRIVASSL
ncbi:MAG: hypothetical protein M1497_11560 [Nitrospirae bacterium]|nr:hypothetical protein [Nitrospirota bacterium]